MKLTSKTLIIIILLFTVIIFLQKCKNGKPTINNTDTFIKHDTIKIELKGSIKYIPKPYKIEIPHDSLIYVPDTPKNLLEFRDAYFKLLKNNLKKSYYNDTISINDNGLTGYIYSNDTVQKNSILGKNIGYKLTYPKIKEVVTITKEKPKKTMWFIGGSVLTNKPLDKLSGEINFGFLNKKNQFYEIGAQSWNNEAIYKIGIKLKL